MNCPNYIKFRAEARISRALQTPARVFSAQSCSVLSISFPPIPGVADQLFTTVVLYSCWLCPPILSISSFLVRSPEGEVVSQKLHDQCRIFVGILCHIVKFRNGILEGCPGHLAGRLWVVEDLVHEHGVVQCQTKTNGMSHLNFAGFKKDTSSKVFLNTINRITCNK